MPFNFLNQGQTSEDATRFLPTDTFIDPVSKIRVSNPANLIDTDFEYGLQPTKWETVEIINNTPAFFSKSGDTTIPDITGITTNGGTREITVTTAFPHNLDVGIPIRVSGTKSLTADGSYIINATPTDTTFTYLSRANQPETISIFDLYSSIITGEFFQGSQISIADAEGMTTDGVGPQSTITIKTANKHGFGPLTPFYFLNINSTVSKEFESQNSTSLSFDPTNSATAQSFDGSNTLLQTPVNLSNSATTSIYENAITSTDPSLSTINISIAQGDETSWDSLEYGDPLYYDIAAGSGYFQANPRGVVFIKSVDLVNTTQNVATFQVSEVPDGETLSVVSNMTGYFKIADQAKTFAGNNVDEQSQVEITIQEGQEFLFDGGNQGYDGIETDPPSNVATVVGYTGTTMTVFTSEGTLDYYVGAMLEYNSDGTEATGLSNSTTYFVTAFSPGASAGLYSMSIAELPGGSDIDVSGGSGTQTFSKIGVSVDKDIVHVRNSDFPEGAMLEYSYPTGGNFGADFEQKFYFVTTKYDIHNYSLSEEIGFSPLVATGGDAIIDTYIDGRFWKIHAFTTVGTDNFVIDAPGSDGAVDALIVAGGGGAGRHHGGGAGGGGIVSASALSVSAQSYSVTVGGGGSRTASGNSGAPQVAGTNGGNSTAFGLTAIGGGGSGNNGTNGSDGGSGGGPGNWSQGRSGGDGLQPTSASGGFGNDAADNNGTVNYGGGGGGAGASPNSTNSFNNGGAGKYFGDLYSDTFGENGYFSGGGASGTYPGYDRYTGDNTGGIGGGGNGGRGPHNSGTNGQNGAANTGGGGGGTADLYRVGGNGGSGIVLIRYPVSPEPTGEFIVASGGEVSLVEEEGVRYAVHKFTSVGSNDFTVTDGPTEGVNTEVEYLIVAAGGGGGRGNNRGYEAGGGGAGGLLTGTASITSPGTYPAVVGQGRFDNNGTNSTFLGFTAIGGGKGANGGQNGSSGGSGGGGAHPNTPGGAGTAGQGFAGARPNRNSAGGGGGGAGERGDADGQGHGGDGVQSSITGTATYYAGGGSGSRPAGTPGLGGGGAGLNSLNGGYPQNGTDGLGGGGGAQYASDNRSSSRGGHGVVIVRYQVGVAQ